MAAPSGLSRKNSASTPLRSSKPRAAARCCCWRNKRRGHWAMGAPLRVRSAAIQPTPLCQGRAVRLAGSGTASTSPSAGERSSQAAKPAKPAPSLAIGAMAEAGTSLARWMPNRSVNDTSTNCRLSSCRCWLRSVEGCDMPVAMQGDGALGAELEKRRSMPRCDAAQNPGSLARRASTIARSRCCSGGLLWGLPARWPSSDSIRWKVAPGMAAASAARSSGVK